MAVVADVADDDDDDTDDIVAPRDVFVSCFRHLRSHRVSASLHVDLLVVDRHDS